MKNTNCHCEARRSCGNLNRLLSIVLVMILLFSVLPMTAFAVENDDLAETGATPTSGYTVGCQWNYDSGTRTLTISGDGYMGEYSDYDKPPWKEFTIVNIVIKSGTGGGPRNIGDYAFAGLDVRSVTINSKNIEYIGASAFQGCDELESITIPDSVTIIKECAFDACYKLKSVKFGSNIKTIGEFAFSGGWELTSIDIPDSVESIERYAFCYCTGLTSVTLGNGLKSIKEKAFQGTKNLTEIAFPDSLETIGREAFIDTGLMSVTLGRNITDIGELAFGYLRVDTHYVDRNRDFVIYGYTGSEAEWYANKCGFDFVDLESPIIINSVSVYDIIEPVAGAYPSNNYSYPANSGYYLEKHWNGRVTWYTEDGDILDPQADKFQAGERYNAQVTVLALDGYAFADKGLTGTMNGKDVTGSIFTVNATKFYMSRWFTCSDSIIKKVSVTGFTKPVTGMSPSYSAVVSGGNGYQISNTNNTFTKNGIAWFNMTDSTFLFPANNNKFAAGKEYGVFITLETISNDYQFSDEPSATVNGKPATISAKGKSSITVFYIFNGSYILGDADDNGEIESVDATFVQRSAAGIYTPYITQVLMQGDVDGDGNLTVMDVTAIQYYLCHLKTPYLIGQTIL